MFPSDFGKMLMYTGIGLAVLGAVLHFGGKVFPIGRLPGDLRWESGTFGIYLPIASSIIISIVLTVVLNLFFRR